jgi:DnaJ-class molecular chaperone
MQLERGATDKDVKKAYRQLSLIYHPDKNPDPAAATYFAEYITKAYKALTGANPAGITTIPFLMASHVDESCS